MAARDGYDIDSISDIVDLSAKGYDGADAGSKSDGCVQSIIGRYGRVHAPRISSRSTDRKDFRGISSYDRRSKPDELLDNSGSEFQRSRRDRIKNPWRCSILRNCRSFEHCRG